MDKTRNNTDSPNYAVAFVWGIGNVLAYRASSLTNTSTPQNESFSAVFLISSISLLIYLWFQLNKAEANEAKQSGLMMKIIGTVSLFIGIFISGLVLTAIFFVSPPPADL